MVNPIGHWIRVPFCTRSRIPLRGLSGFRGIGFWITLRGLSGFRVPLGLVVPAQSVCSCGSVLVPIIFSFTGSTVMALGDPPTMSPTISFQIQFCEITFIFVCWIFSSCTCLSRITFVLGSCLVWSPRILFVSTSCSTWIWSAFTSIERLSIAEAISRVGTTSSAL